MLMFVFPTSQQTPSIYYTARLMFMHVLPICLNIFPQYEMYIIERNAERTASAGRLLYDMWVKVNCHLNTYVML